VSSHRTNLHFLRIAEHLNSPKTQLTSWPHAVAARYAQAWGDSAISQGVALKKLWLLAYREAQVMAFADAYLAIALCFVVSGLMVPLIRRVAQPGKRVHSASHCGRSSRSRKELSAH
jgi:MFS transporter, DHA2 family, multidrug resistance protein